MKTYALIDGIVMDKVTLRCCLTVFSNKRGNMFGFTYSA